MNQALDSFAVQSKSICVIGYTYYVLIKFSMFSVNVSKFNQDLLLCLGVLDGSYGAQQIKSNFMNIVFKMLNDLYPTSPEQVNFTT